MQDARDDGELRARLLEWFAREKRALPWRESRDPYRVWISEAMLQQTRVEAVVPYYRRFVERFPDARALAEASIDDVLAHWSGLGYYRRARALHAAAAAIVGEHGGVMPRSAAELLRLPGIGPYTAGAVASIAFDEPAPLVDGNVARVLARLFAIDADQASQSFRAAAWSTAARLVAAGGDAGAWNQALMELGAVVCTPRDPDCDACPVRAGCRAHIEGRVLDLPRPKARKAPIEVELLVLVVVDGERILLEQRPPEGRMAGLWQLPTIETSPGGRLAPARFAAADPGATDPGVTDPDAVDPEATELLEPGRVALEAGDLLGEVRHTITCHRVRARVHVGRLIGAARAPLVWTSRRALDALPRTGMTKKIAARGWIGSGVEART